MPIKVIDAQKINSNPSQKIFKKSIINTLSQTIFLEYFQNQKFYESEVIYVYNVQQRCNYYDAINLIVLKNYKIESLCQKEKVLVSPGSKIQQQLLNFSFKLHPSFQKQINCEFNIKINQHRELSYEQKNGQIPILIFCALFFNSIIILHYYEEIFDNTVIAFNQFAARQTEASYFSATIFRTREWNQVACIE
ncbi:hypothetical protein FGO68_gene5017 [Halteria grandinella]|uniref:Uncharacterized protein n=1 Tax=Halteria grandinella TaxID=5974 RepID=A0A8J8NAP7_HALGN|nr:hypothetical protein FGO68_gene5017 [Halteria grandinella]